MAKVWVLQHVGCETLGLIGDAFDNAGLTARYVRTFAGERGPATMDDAAGLVVMGGPMGVYDHSRYPHLLDEMRLIEGALRQGKPVLGVCLGSQLLAHALGAAVTKGRQKEIGWHRVRLADAAVTDVLLNGVDRTFTAYHWHGDVFELPRGAVSLASSDLTACQAFRSGENAYGFLFHMEVTEKIISAMVATFADELAEVNASPQTIMEGIGQHLPGLQRIAQTVFPRWASLAR